MKARLRYYLLLLLSLVGLTVYGQAPTVSYATPETFYEGILVNVAPSGSAVSTPAAFGAPVDILSGGPGYNAWGVVRDAKGNTYFSDYYGGSVFELLVGQTTPISIGSGFNNPRGIAVDSLGNVYVADFGNNAIKKIPPGAAPITIGTGFTSPEDVAADAAGNVYVAELGATRIRMIPAGGGTPVIAASGFISTFSVKLDKAGNLYVADSNTGKVSKFPTGGGAPIVILNLGVGSVLTYIAVDSRGDLFTNVSQRVYMHVPGSPVNQYYGIQLGLVTRGSLFADDNLNVYQGVGDVYKSSPSGGYFLNTALSVGLKFNNNTGVISGAPLTLSEAADYTVTAYNPTSSASATVNIKVIAPPNPTLSYSSPQTVYAGRAMTPIAPSSTYVGQLLYNPTPAQVVSGFSVPSDVAMDASGNIFIADGGHRQIKKIPAGSNTPQVIYTSTDQPINLAVDQSDNVYFSLKDTIANIFKLPAGSSTATAYGSGFSTINGIAVDASGNVYVTDYNNNSVKKIPAGNGQPVTVGSGFTHPYNVRIDGVGNLYVSDQGGKAIKEIQAGTGTVTTVAALSFYPTYFNIDAGNLYIDSAGTVVLAPAVSKGHVNVASGLSSPRGFTLDAAHNLYVTDWGNNKIKKFAPVGGYFISPVLPYGLTFDSTTGIISGNPQVTSPATNYNIMAYNYSSVAAATLNFATVLPPLPTISYASPQTYVQGVAITPLSPTNTNVYPLGYSSAITTLGSGFNVPTGVWHDASGNIYVADNGNNAVKEIPSGGGTPVAIGSGFSHPAGVTVDPAGNIYVADAGNNAVKEIPAGSNTPVSIGSGFNAPTGVVVDLSGNIYIADAGNNAVKEILSGSNTPITLAGGFNDPYSVAVDGAGYIYVVDVGNNCIKRIPPGGGTPVSLYIINGVYGVAVSPEGNLYYSSVSTNSIVMIPAGSNTSKTIATGFNSPVGLMVDGAGRVYVADEGNNIIKLAKPAGGNFISPVLPAGLLFSSATGVISGTPTALSPATNYRVTAYNISGNNSATVNINVTANPALSNLAVNAGTLSPAFSPGTFNYADAVGNTAAIKVTPTTADPLATVTVNGTAVASGTASGPIALSPGTNTIAVVVTASDGVTKQTYTITVGQGSNDAYLASLHVTGQTISPSFAFKTLNYTASVPNGTSSVTISASVLEAHATMKVNGTAFASQTVSPPIALAVGSNVISIVVTAQDGVTTQTYTVTVTRAGSNDAYLASLHVTGQTISPSFVYTTFNYTASVPNGASSVTISASVLEAHATMMLNGAALASQTISPPIALAVGSNVINIIVTAQDGVTTQTYTVTVTRAAHPIASYAAIGVSNPANNPVLAGEDVTVHAGVSPNGDGIDDIFTIENIANYPQNKLMIMNRSGIMVYKTEGYDNITKAFDGHSNITGRMQLPGTYFYALDYVVNGVSKRKTGFIVLKY